MKQSHTSHPVTNLSLSVHGEEITDQQLRAVLERFYPNSFTRDDFEREFQHVCLKASHDKDTIRRVMQHLKRRQQIIYGLQSKIWSFTENAVFDYEIVQTLPLPVIKDLPAKRGKPSWVQGFIKLAQKLVLHMACLFSVLALMALNASFAYGLAGTLFFQIAFVTGLIASDLMRPMLIATGLKSFDQKQMGRGVLAFVVALSLAPVSVLSSTTVISAALSLGAEANEQQTARSTTRQTLQSEYKRLQFRAGKEWQLYKTECKRGGCGKRAKRHESAAKSQETKMEKLLPKIIALTKTDQQKSSFVSRSVKAFEGLNLYGKGRELLIPILLALTLEIAALFGPGLLLGKKNRKNQS